MERGEERENKVKEREGTGGKGRDMAHPKSSVWHSYTQKQVHTEACRFVSAVSAKFCNRSH